MHVSEILLAFKQAYEKGYFKNEKSEALSTNLHNKAFGGKIRVGLVNDFHENKTYYVESEFSVSQEKTITCYELPIEVFGDLGALSQRFNDSEQLYSSIASLKRWNITKSQEIKHKPFLVVNIENVCALFDFAVKYESSENVLLYFENDKISVCPNGMRLEIFSKVGIIKAIIAVPKSQVIEFCDYLIDERDVENILFYIEGIELVCRLTFWNGNHFEYRFDKNTKNEN